MGKINRVPFGVVSSFIVFVGVLYSYAYWSSFNINVFEYAGIQELVVAAIYSLALVILVTAVSAIPHIMLSSWSQWKDAVEESCKEESTSLPFIFAVWFGCTLVSVWAFDTLWALALLTGIPLLWAVEKSRAMWDLNSVSVRIMIQALIFVPGVAVFHGKTAAADVLKGHIYFEATINEELVRHVGHSGSKTFFINADNTKVFIIPGGEATLELTHIDYSPASVSELLHRWGFKKE